MKIANSIHIREIFEDTDLSNYLINVSLTLFIENDLIPFINNIIEQSHREKGLTPKSDKNSQFFDKIDTLIKQMTIYQKKITLLKKSLLRKETNNLLQDVLSLYSKMYQESHNTKILDSEKKKSKGFDLELAKTLHRFHTYHDQMQNLSKTLVSNYKQMINNYETIQNNNFFQFPVVIRKVYEFNAIVFAFNSLILQ